MSPEVRQTLAERGRLPTEQTASNGHPNRCRNVPLDIRSSVLNAVYSACSGSAPGLSTPIGAPTEARAPVWAILNS